MRAGALRGVLLRRGGPADGYHRHVPWRAGYQHPAGPVAQPEEPGKRHGPPGGEGRPVGAAGGGGCDGITKGCPQW